jgi:coenzyme F420-0:L-glutamate ligase/coenzyme F420-1:gamma-L-glutamate ligase
MNVTVPRIEVRGLPGLPRVRPGDDVGALIAGCGPDLADGDVVVVTSKVVAKAEGRVVRGVDREAVVDAETVREVARRGQTRIVETRHGFVMAAAGVDASNTEPGTFVLLPEDPDASARAIRRRLAQLCSVDVAVVITDTFGRPWRTGLVDGAVGAAGLTVLEDLRGQLDPWGVSLELTVTAVADEVAAAADLVKGKRSLLPVAVVRGLARFVTAGDGPGARTLVRPADGDMFRVGASETAMAVLAARRTVREFRPDPVDGELVRRAVAAAVTAPAPHHTTPWRFVAVRDGDTRSRLLDAMEHAWTADLSRDGWPAERIQRRIHRGRVLRDAPLIVVPCLVQDGVHAYADQRRARAEESMFLVAMGAGVQNFLVALAAGGLGSAWVSSGLFCQSVVRDVLRLPDEWAPMGTVAVGYPAAPVRPRTDRNPDDFLLQR